MLAAMAGYGGGPVENGQKKPEETLTARLNLNPFSSKLELPYTEANLRAQLREIDPTVYDRLIKYDRALPYLFEDIIFHASFADTFSGPTELMKKYYYNIFKTKTGNPGFEK